MGFKKVLSLAVVAFGLTVTGAAAKTHFDVEVGAVGPVFPDDYGPYGDDGWGPWVAVDSWPNHRREWVESDYVNSLNGWGYTDVVGGCDRYMCDYIGVRDGHRHHYRIDREYGHSWSRRHRDR